MTDFSTSLHVYVFVSINQQQGGLNKGSLLSVQSRWFQKNAQTLSEGEGQKYM